MVLATTDTPSIGSLNVYGAIPTRLVFPILHTYHTFPTEEDAGGRRNTTMLLLLLLVDETNVKFEVIVVMLNVHDLPVAVQLFPAFTLLPTCFAVHVKFELVKPHATLAYWLSPPLPVTVFPNESVVLLMFPDQDEYGDCTLPDAFHKQGHTIRPAAKYGINEYMWMLLVPLSAHASSK